MAGIAATRSVSLPPSRSKVLSLIAVFSALIAVSTLFSIPAPAPLGEVTWSPPIYLALSVLAGPWVGAAATGIGSFTGEALGIPLKGNYPIWAPGMVWARVPEALMVGWARKRSKRVLASVMVVATVYETLAFFFPDWAFYTFGVFYGSGSTGIWPGFTAALWDLGTLVDLVYIPVAFAVIIKAGPVFRRLGFE